MVNARNVKHLSLLMGNYYRKSRKLIGIHPKPGDYVSMNIELEDTIINTF